nr:hypothetical protein [uncultured Chitinophaga sp.]
MKQILTIICYLLAPLSLFSQGENDVDAVQHILRTERSCKQFVHRLDSLKTQQAPIKALLDRDMGFSYRHQRIGSADYGFNYNIDLLTKEDTIVLAVLSRPDGGILFKKYDSLQVQNYLSHRNKFYQSSRSIQQLFKELPMRNIYAFYCGDGLPKTDEGKYIEQLVEEENTAVLTDMLQSFNCETQAYGVAGFLMLEERDYDVPYTVQRLISHIKKRNSELLTCSGCFSGIVEKIYSRKK